MRWQDSLIGIDWNALSELYRIAPLGEKSPEDLKLCFSMMGPKRVSTVNKNFHTEGITRSNPNLKEFLF